MKKILLNNNVSPIKGLSSLNITSSFGNRTFFNGKTGKNVTNFHSGIDLTGGTMVVATSSGIITSVRTSIKGYDEYNSAGNYVLIYHGNNVYTKYCHLKYGSVKVKKNDIVQAGTILGTTGATGFATGVHLHYAVKENGKWVDPLDYLTGNKQLPSLENSTPIVDTGSKDLISYKVQKGDTLTKIAKMYKTTISELVNLNNIQKPNLIITGTILKVLNNNVENVSNNYYIVKKGDTLSGIAKKYNTTWKKIYNDNKNIIGNNPNLIKIGQKLLIK